MNNSFVGRRAGAPRIGSMTTGWPRIWLIYAIGVVAAGQLGIVPPLVPALQRELGLSLAAAGTAVSLVTLASALIGLPAGGWCERIGHARALRLGLLIMITSAVLGAMADNAALLLAARALTGAGYLLVVIAAPSLMTAAAEPRHHAVVLSLWGTFVPTGIALAGLMAAGLDRAGWRAVFVIDAVVLVVAFIAARHAAAQRLWLVRPERNAALGPVRAAAPLAVAFFCFALLFLALAGLLQAWLVEQRGLASADAGRIVAIATAFAIAGSLLAPRLLRRGAAPGRLIAAALLLSTAIAALSFNPTAPLPLAVLGFALAFLIGGLVPAATFACVPSIAITPSAIGPLNGLLAQAGSLGSLAGPPVLALWVDMTGWSLAPALLLLAIAALGAAAALAVRSSA